MNISAEYLALRIVICALLKTHPDKPALNQAINDVENKLVANLLNTKIDGRTLEVTRIYLDELERWCQP